MVGKIVFEKLSEKNFEDFIELITQLAYYEKLAPPDSEAIKRMKKDGIKRKRFSTYVVRLNNQYIGYIVYYMTYSTFLGLQTFFLEDLFLLKEFRRMGIGQKMFDFCVKKAHQCKCGRLDLMVLSWNTPAIKFYEKNGMELIDLKICRLEGKQLKNSMRGKIK